MPNYDDKTVLTDLLSYQKFMTANYNNYLNEAANSAVRSTLSKLLTEEHEIQHEIFTVMHDRGYYPVTPAEQKQVNAAKDTFCATCGV